MCIEGIKRHLTTSRKSRYPEFLSLQRQLTAYNSMHGNSFGKQKIENMITSYKSSFLASSTLQVQTWSKLTTCTIRSLKGAHVQHSFVTIIIIILQILPHFPNFLDISFSLLLRFLPVLSLETNVCSILKFNPVFPGVMLSIRSSLLFLMLRSISFSRIITTNYFCLRRPDSDFQCPFNPFNGK